MDWIVCYGLTNTINRTLINRYLVILYPLSVRDTNNNNSSIYSEINKNSCCYNKTKCHSQSKILSLFTTPLILVLPDAIQIVT